MALGLTASSGSSVKNEVATTSRASSDQTLNQSIVQHVTSEGNCLSRARNGSPLGLNKLKKRKMTQKILTKPNHRIRKTKMLFKLTSCRVQYEDCCGLSWYMQTLDLFLLSVGPHVVLLSSLMQRSAPVHLLNTGWEHLHSSKCDLYPPEMTRF